MSDELKTANELLGDQMTREDSCEIHGKFISRKFPRIGLNRWSSCPLCMEEKAKANDIARAKLSEIERENREREAWAKKIDASGIPMRFHGRTFEAFIADTPEKVVALNFARSYATEFDLALEKGRSAIFSGRPGTGKTHLAAAIGKELLGNGFSVLFITVIRAMRMIKDTWRRDSAISETEMIKAFTKPDLLILDEVGVQFGSDTEKILLFDVINERYERCMPTLLLSNLTLEGAREYLGDRVFDRLKEGGGGYVPFTWESMRGAM